MPEECIESLTSALPRAIADLERIVLPPSSWPDWDEVVGKICKRQPDTKSVLFLVRHTVLCLQVKAVKKFSISYRETAKLLLLPEVSIKLRCCVVLQEITFLCCSLDPLQKTHVEKIQMLPPLLNNQCSVAIILQVIIIPPEVPGII